MQKEEYLIKNACYSVTKYYLCKRNNKRSLSGRKQRLEVVRSFPNRYQFSCINKVTSLFSNRYIFIIILKCKNPLFVRQKPYFCNAKTILLFFVSITNTLLMCYEYSVKWLRTFHKMPTNTPQGVGDRFIVPVSLHYQIYIFVSPNTCFHIIKYAFPFPISWVFPYMRAR